MDEDTYIQSLIAQYLRDKDLTKTLSTLELELNKKFTNPVHDESLQSIIKDRINFKSLDTFSQSNAIENINTLDTFTQSDIIKAKNIILPNWTMRFPNSCQVVNLGTLKSLIINSSYFEAIVNNIVYNIGLFVTNTKYLFAIDLDTNCILLSLFDPLNGQPIKIITGIPNTNHIIISDMNGSVTSMKFLIDKDTDSWNLVNSLHSKSSNVKLHRRLITDFKFMAFKENNNSSLLGYFASIGWDSRINVGSLHLIDGKIQILVIGDYKLFTNPTSVLMLKDKVTNLPIILVGRLESSLLTIFTVSSHNEKNNKLIEIAKLSLNDSEFSSHSFQPMAMATISFHDNDTIITIATDHVPYMRLITVVVPSLDEILACELGTLNIDTKGLDVYSTLEKMSKTHSEAKESFQSKTPILRSYIMSNFNSLSPQDKYSNAIILSRPHCSGLWIPGDDGKLRGFDLRTGTVIETLDSNDGRAKSAFIGKCGNDSEVIVVCGAVDKKICIWKCSA